ncbi:NAD binding domain of 6-phosphogluconate dehydrogenase-domain-containing protein [Hypoxylon argillaceum]|nr:NAD binding domain of 6-phosphogluconate dehydrogenase-domain-containing protein [Hypoxylon argillaceum]
MAESENNVFVTVSALDAGHITLPDCMFVAGADPEVRTTVPSLSFLIQHPASSLSRTEDVTNLVFDLGVKRDLSGYAAAQQPHLSVRQPIISHPDCSASLRHGASGNELERAGEKYLIDPEKEVDYVVLSHVHWDHIGTPRDFSSSTFVVGSGTLNLLRHGAGPFYPAEQFNRNELPAFRTVELPHAPNSNFNDYYAAPSAPKHTPTPHGTQAKLPAAADEWSWQPFSGFPRTIDFFGDQSVYVIDSPGHIYGHVNLLARISEGKYVYLGGDCCHDTRILSGEKEIAEYDDGRGGLRSVHVHTGLAKHTLAEIDAGLLIGLGVMGYPMAKNLLSGLGPEKTLLICDVSTEALDRFVKEAQGQATVEVVGTGYEAAKAADTVITMLPGSDAVKSVYLDPDTGVLAGAVAAAAESGSPPPKLIMECGTIETDTILAVGSATQEVSASKLGGTLAFVDAPVSGGPMGAEAGTLAFMAGCSPSVSDTVFPIAKSYLKHMGTEKDIYLCGDVGAGTAFKVINNYLSAITSLAASEALNIGTKAGLDVKLLTEVINASGGQCWVTSKSNPVPGVQANVPSSRDYNGGFRIELCAKVLGMGSKLAKSVGARTVLDVPTLEAFHEAMGDERYRGKDARVVYKWLNESEK